MLVYQSTKSGFMDHVERDVIVERISEGFRRHVRQPPKAEIRAWHNSMQYMYKVLNTDDIPGGCGVAVEYGVPYTSSRIDFLLTGRRPPDSESAVIIELKQWQDVEAVPGKDGIVRTFVGRGMRETAHPSYQAWSYARMIEDYNESVREARIGLGPCAYLHNYRLNGPEDPLVDEAYADYLEAAPVYCAGDVLRLRDFICRHITHADDGRVLYHIESGRLRPSKSLQDALAGMLDGNEEFVMIDDQKVVFEEALALAKEAREAGEKRVLLVRGGPGTGKSVVAVNLLVRLTGEDMVAQYVSKNAAPRHVYSTLLREHRRTKAFIDNLFRSSGGYYDVPDDSFDALVVDEAHRLNEKSGFYGNLGENQIQELVDAAGFSVFFIDESQRVTTRDAGTVEDVRLAARRAGARLHEMRLTSQFRCNGSDSYLDWLDATLGITADDGRSFSSLEYDFRVFDDPHELFEAIRARNARNKARVVAGYCWEWPTSERSDPDAPDVVIPEYGFAKSWNLGSTDTWAIDGDSIEQVGCVHTAQGLEFDYVGVIVGDDLRFEDGEVVTDPDGRAKSDTSLRGLKKMAKTDPERARRLADELIRNTYRVLMTRGMKGCYVFCTDPALAAHLRSRMPETRYAPEPAAPPMAAEGSPED